MSQSTASAGVRYETRDRVAIVTIDRPDVRNAVDQATAEELAAAFRRFDDDPDLAVAVLTGGHRHFCAGADLQALATGGEENRVTMLGDGPMGPTRLQLSKPVIAAIEGFAVAGKDSVLGVFCRRFGVPLVDLGTVRLPRLIGHGRALDLILTGRPVTADEALRIGLVDRVVETGKAFDAALALAQELVAMPQVCMRSDRLSVYEQWDLSWDEAIANETRRGLEVLASGETVEGAARFARGAGRGGRPVEVPPPAQDDSPADSAE